MKHRIITGILIVMALLASSCDMNVPTVPQSGLDPKQQPDTPGNVNVVSGLDNQIMVTWDRVWNADSYQVFFVDASNPASNHNTLLSHAVTTNRANVQLDSYDAPDIDSGRSYYFYVVAYKSFNGQQLYSNQSEYVEGAVSPQSKDILHHGYITGTAINLYWNVPTLFSIDNANKMLYEAEFKLQYRNLTADGDSAAWETISGEGDPQDDVYLFDSIDLNQWPQNTTLEFQILMTITPSDGSRERTVISEPFQILVSNDMTPSPVTNVTYTKQDAIDSIILTWSVPEWTGAADSEEDADISYFKIEKRVAGADEYETLIDEISNGQDRKTITPAGTDADSQKKFSYTDTEVEPGVVYEYRITNGAKALNSELLYAQNEEDAFVIEDACLFDNPGISSASGNVTSNDSANASISFSWTSENFIPEGLAWKIERTTYHTDKEAEVSVLDASVLDVTSQNNSDPAAGEEEKPVDYSKSYNATITEILGCDYCNNSEHKYSYRPVLVGEGEVYPAQSKEFKLTSETENVLDDEGKLILKAEELIEGQLSVEPRIRRHIISWTAKSLEGATYSYILDETEKSFEEGSLTSESVPDSEGMVKYTADIKVPDGLSHDITIIGEAGNTYRSVRRLDDISAAGLSDEFQFSASGILDENSESRISVSWTPDGLATIKDFDYQILYREAGQNAWTRKTINQTTGNYVFQNELVEGNVYDFSFAVHDITYKEIEYYKSVETLYFATVRNISATKGNNGSVTVTWDSVDKVSGYEVFRYEEGKELEDATYVGKAETAEFTDTTAEAGKKYYYAVSALKDEYNSDIFVNAVADTANQFGKLEAGNMGYVYNNKQVADFSVTDSYASETTLNPYFVISFIADETNSVYKLTAANDSTGFAVDVSQLTTREGNIWTNGLAENEKGYVALNTDTLDVTVNADIGVINTEYAVTNFTIQAWQNENSENTTEANTITENHYKDLDVYDYLFLVNTALSIEIGNADSAVGYDWWGGGDTIFGIETGDSRYYQNQEGTISITTCHSSLGSSDMNPGSINLTEYRFGDVILQSGNLSFMAVHQDAGDGGYLDDDPLERIGTDANNRTVSASFEKPVEIDGRSITFKSANIVYNDVFVDADNNKGTYDVIISGGESRTGIAKTDAKVVQNIAVGVSG